MNTYKTEFFAACPTNGVRVKYQLEINSNNVLRVEEIIAAHTAKLLEGVALPEPDFALDGGQRHCYYADTVAAALSAARAELSARDAEIAGLRARIAAELQDAVGCGNQYEANLCMRLIGAMSGQAGEAGK